MMGLATSNEDSLTVTMQLSQEPMNVSLRDRDHFTPLHEATKTGHLSGGEAAAGTTGY